MLQHGRETQFHSPAEAGRREAENQTVPIRRSQTTMKNFHRAITNPLIFSALGIAAIRRGSGDVPAGYGLARRNGGSPMLRFCDAIPLCIVPSWGGK
jgi:hypothetical protein